MVAQEQSDGAGATVPPTWRAVPEERSKDSITVDPFGIAVHPGDGALIDLPSYDDDDDGQIEAQILGLTPGRSIPLLSICIMIAGTRGDVQPFIALGLRLKAFGHRVRLATHGVYRSFVTKYGLEFYPLGGDPVVLSDYIVRNRGVIPSSAADAMTNMAEVQQLLFSTWGACSAPDPESLDKPFSAQAIIANPVSYGHIHCAEKLQIPLHMYFTMPWTTTAAFPSPLVTMSYSDRPRTKRNRLSYKLVNKLMYSGMYVMTNNFREKVLGLRPLGMGNKGSNLFERHGVPFGYCWSPSLVPKPADWDSLPVDVCGYFFLPPPSPPTANPPAEGSSTAEPHHTAQEEWQAAYNPPPELAAFISAGAPPVYIGFGSLMVDNPQKLTQDIVAAAEAAGVRVLLSRGWGKLGEGVALPDSVLSIGDVPHDWLLPRCSAVVHHGGAGTTAAGLLAACPTTIIPFFGDQHFWGGVVARAGVGPPPIPVDALNATKLTAALKFMMQPEAKEAAARVAAAIAAEDGVGKGVEAFHRNLPLYDLAPDGLPRVAWDLAPPTVGMSVSQMALGVDDMWTEIREGWKHKDPSAKVMACTRGCRAMLVDRPVYGCQAACNAMGCYGCCQRRRRKRALEKKYDISSSSQMGGNSSASLGDMDDDLDPLIDETVIPWCIAATACCILLHPYGCAAWLCVPGCTRPWSQRRKDPYGPALIPALATHDHHLQPKAKAAKE